MDEIFSFRNTLKKSGATVLWKDCLKVGSGGNNHTLKLVNSN
jgi:hypothetical protein